MNKKLFLCVAIIIFLDGFIFSASRTEAEINVYDNDGQYLGIYKGHSVWSGVGIFIPSSGKFIGLYKLQDATGSEAVPSQSITHPAGSPDCERIVMALPR